MGANVENKFFGDKSFGEIQVTTTKMIISIRNAALIEKEKNLLRQKYIESALTSESFAINFRPCTYNILHFLTLLP